MNKKYELVMFDSIEIDGHVLYRIRALRDIYDEQERLIVKKNELGGYVENESNLSHEDSCWICDDAKVYNGSIVSDHAIIYWNAEISDFSCITDHVRIFDNAKVSNHSRIADYARIYRNAEINQSVIADQAIISDNAKVYDHSLITKSACVFGQAQVYNRAKVKSNAQISGDVHVFGYNTIIDDQPELTGDAIISSSYDYLIFKNDWSSYRQFTYTKSNKMWKVDCFYGTGEELIAKAYQESTESGRKYEAYVNLVKILEN